MFNKMLIKLFFNQFYKFVTSAYLEPDLLVSLVFKALWARNWTREPNLHIRCLLVQNVGAPICHLDCKNTVCVVNFIKHFVLAFFQGVGQVLQGSKEISD